MQKTRTRVLARALAIALAAGTAATAAPPLPAGAAAKPKLSKTKLSLEVGKKKKITIKKVKAKQIKKLTVAPKKKGIVAVKKNGKSAFTVTAKKAGSTKIAVSIKVGKKTTKQTLSVTVKAAGGQAAPDATAAPGGAATAAPGTAATAAPGGAATAAPGTAATAEPGTDATAEPEPTEPGPTPLVSYKEDFESFEVNEKDPGDWYGRGNTGCEFKVIEPEEGGHNNSWKAGLMTRPDDGDSHSWNGPAMDLTKILTLGATYKVSFWAKVPESEENEVNRSGLQIMLSGVQYISELDKNEGNSHYENYPRDTWTVINADDWTKVETTFTLPDYCYEFIMYIETTDQRAQFGRSSFLIDDFEIEMVSKPEPYDPTLQSIKDAYEPFGLKMGVAVRYDQLLNDNTFGFIKHHFNSISTEDEMKLDEMLGLQGDDKVPLKFKDKEEAAAAGYVLDDDYVGCDDNTDEDGNVLVPEIKFSKFDRILNIAKENGIQVRMHSPFWHTQMPQFFFTKDYRHYDTTPWSADVMKTNADYKDRYTDQDTMYTRIRMYVYTLLKHVKDKGYEDTVSAYDVVNEYLNSDAFFQDSTQKYANYWAGIFDKKSTTNSEYVKYAFKSANDALVEYGIRDKVRLMYNDFNTYNNTSRIIELIGNVNASAPDGQKYCDGVGMQSHVGTGNPTPQKFGETIKAFSDAGLEVQITELDMGSPAVEGETPEQIEESTEFSRQDQADAMGRLMAEVIRQKKAGANLTSVTLWGVCDAASWTDASAPLLFGTSVADKKPSFDAFVQAALDQQ